ncbi:hypothetical protein BD626DRAFT_479222, partial [Schizophyllum amplum]
MVIQFLSPLLPGLCLQPGGAMTLPLQYRLVSSGESSSRPPSPLSLGSAPSLVYRRCGGRAQTDWALFRFITY